MPNEESRPQLWEVLAERRSPGSAARIRARNEAREPVLKELIGRLWHTTREDRFERILLDGAILPEPDIPNSDRWKTSAGPALYPYVRTIGGVSLFDFAQFEPESYSEQYPMSSWYTFIPWREGWDSAVWIEIDREQIASGLIPGAELVERWKAEQAFTHTIMPLIEAAYIGPLPCSAFKRAFLVREGNGQLQALSVAH